MEWIITHFHNSLVHLKPPNYAADCHQLSALRVFDNKLDSSKCHKQSHNSYGDTSVESPPLRRLFSTFIKTSCRKHVQQWPHEHVTNWIKACTLLRRIEVFYLLTYKKTIGCKRKTFEQWAFRLVFIFGTSLWERLLRITNEKSLDLYQLIVYNYSPIPFSNRLVVI